MCGLNKLSALRVVLFLCFFISQETFSQEDKTLKISVEYMPDSFDYTQSSTVWTDQVLVNITEGLFSTDAKGNLMLGQAESWSISEDGLQYHFKLRDDIYWSDGKPVIADDFVLSWQRIVDPKIKNYHKALLEPVKNHEEVSNGTLPATSLGVEAIDKKNLLVTLSEPTAFFLKILQFYVFSPLPSHYTPAEINQMLSGDPENIVVNGAFGVRSASSEEIVLGKNPRYWDASKVYFDSIKFMSVGDSEGKADVKAVISGEVDITFNRSPEELRWVKEMHPEYLIGVFNASTEYYMFNLEKQLITQHADVREALSMAIDRDKLCRHILKDSAMPTLNLTPASMFDYYLPEKPAWTQLSYPERLQKAAQVLKARGVTPDNPVTVELKTQDTNSNRYRVALAIKHAWEKLGVNVNIEKSSTPDLYKKIRLGDYQIARAGWLADFSDPYNFLHLMGSGQVRYAGLVAHPKVDALLSESLQVVDQKQRELLYKEIEEINHKYNLVMPLYNHRDYFLVAPDLKGFGVSPFAKSLRWVRRES